MADTFNTETGIPVAVTVFCASSQPEPLIGLQMVLARPNATATVHLTPREAERLERMLAEHHGLVRVPKRAPNADERRLQADGLRLAASLIQTCRDLPVDELSALLTTMATEIERRPPDDTFAHEWSFEKILLDRQDVIACSGAANSFFSRPLDYVREGAREVHCFDAGFSRGLAWGLAKRTAAPK